MTTDIALVLCALGLVLALAAILALVWFARGNTSARAAAEDAAAASARNQLIAEGARDAEHVSRVAAETARDAALKQLTDTQAQLAAVSSEQVKHVHDLIASGSPDALAVFRGVFAGHLSTASAADHAAAGGQGAPPAAVPPTGQAGAARSP